MFSKVYKFIFLLLIIIVAQLFFASLAMARPLYQPQIKPLESCLACHENEGGGGDLNSFGRDWVNNGKKFENIKDLDSDNDGFTNEQEIKDETLPGNPSSNRDAKPPYLLISLGVIVGIVIFGFLFSAALKIREKNTEKEKAEG